MWWRALGVAVVLLCAGVVGGYAVADRSEEAPETSATLEPVPAVSPAMPTPPEQSLLPDPDTPALLTDLPSHETELRLSRHGIGVSALVPDGWSQSHDPGSSTWTYRVPESPKNQYGLRIHIDIDEPVSIRVARDARISAFEDAVANDDLQAFEVTAETTDTFEATYVDHGYLRVTMERWISFDGANAFAGAAVTGRARDEEGLRDLLVRVMTSMEELHAEPKGDEP